MSHRTLKGTVVLAAAGSLLALSAPAALAAPDAASHKLSVSSDGTTVKVSSPTVAAGTITFALSTTGKGAAGILMFRLQNGATLQKVFADFGEEFAKDPKTDAKGTRDLTHDAVFTGLADPSPGHPITVSEKIPAATYYLLDIDAKAPKVTTLKVTKGSGGTGLGKPAVTVQTTSTDRFKTTTTSWPAKGVVQFDNVSDTLHFVDVSPVKTGATDKQIQAYFDSGGKTPSPFRKGRSFSLEVLSPGNSELATYDLPAGSYALFCFVADKQTGMPHALMGMHQVVTLG